MTMLILLSFLIQAVSGYLFGPSEVTGAVGGSVMVSCHYNPISANIHGRKFWCKVIKKQCITIISTNNYIAQNYINRTYLQNHRDHFKINMTHLQQKDSGIYRCGIGNHNSRFFYAVNVTVSEGNKIPYTSEVIIANRKGSITINCPVPQKPLPGWKYWCKMSKMDVPSCDIMVHSSGYVHQNFWGRVLIQEVCNTTDFKILVNNIKMDDFGFYRCGTGKFDDGSSWTDIHIHILNPTDKIRYQISKSFTRSPGGEFVAQCQTPTSFNSILLIYWCRWNETGCLRLVDSDGFIQNGFQNRISFNTTKMSTIRLTQLELGDTGYYWCVITDGQRVETSSVEVHIIETTTALYSKVSIKEITSGETSIPETHMDVIFRPTSLENLTSTLNLNHTEMSKSRAKQGFYNTTWLNQIGGASILQITSAPATNHVQNSISTTSKNHANIVKDTSSLLLANRNLALTSSPTEQETYLNVTPRPSDLDNLPSTLHPNHTVLNPEISKSRAEQENTTWRHFITADTNQTGAATMVQSSAVPTTATNGIQETVQNITPRPSVLENLPSTLHPNHTVLNPEMSKSRAEQENTTCRHFMTADSNQTGGATIVQLSAVSETATNGIQESTSTTSYNQATGSLVKYISSSLPTSRDKRLTHSTTMEQETTEELYPRTSSKWQTSYKVYLPFTPILTTDSDQETQQNITPRPSDLKNLPSTLHPNHTVLYPETSKSRAEQETQQNVTSRPSDLTSLPSTLHPNHTVLNPEVSKSRAEQENTTWRHFITADNNQTGGATIIQSSAVPATATNGVQESTNTVSYNQATGSLVKYISSSLPTSRDTHLTHSTTMEQETHQNVNPRPSDSENLPSTLHPNHTVLNPEISKSRAEEENTTWRQFSTTDNNQTGGATMIQSSAVPATATNGVQGIEENYGMTAVHKPNSEVTQIGDSTGEPQSRSNQTESSSERQVSSSKNLILVLIPVLAISCVIGFATLISVVMNVRKKRATNTSIHHQENVLMIDKGAAREENTEQHERLLLELTNNSNLRETEV